MDSERWIRIDNLLQGALERPTGERDAFLRNACAGDDELEREVRSLLAARDEAGTFLENPAIAVAARALAVGEDTDAIGEALPHRPATIGRYRIVSLLGQGGMGVVYEAEQESPHRTVALKVVKPGLDPLLLRRFEHETQALARLQHPGIAQIYEAGMADSGLGPQPYFAMEFIRGLTLRDYLNAHHPGVRERLALMAKVCHAVDHAHQRGLIHRDLKPGNILVDESGQPKILDFGIARLSCNEAQVTRHTEVGQLVGTLEYMSPEQVLADPAEIDARSDVYALGVILYEMLAGRRPYRLSPRLHEAARVIREEDPAPLSSASRNYRGDIETIAAKALEKDKARRYESAATLAADIERCLANEPIKARPASTAYLVRKFALRHRALVGGFAAVVVVLVSGIVASATEAVLARHERDRAAAAEQTATRDRDAAVRAGQATSLAEARAIQERNRALAEKQRADTEAATAKAVSDFLQNDLLAQASAAAQAGPNRRPDPDLKVRTALDRAAARIGGKFNGQPLVEASLRQTIGAAYLGLGLYPEAQRQIERALELRRRASGDNDPDTIASLSSLARAVHGQGSYAQSEAMFSRVLELRRRVLGENHHDTLASMNDLIDVYRDETKYAQAAELMDEALKIQRRTLGQENPETLHTMSNLAAVARDQGKFPQAEQLFEKVLEIQRRTLGPEHPDTIGTLALLALQYREEGKFPQSETLYSQTFDLQRRVLGLEHPDTLGTMTMLGVLYRVNGKYAQAEALLKQALEIDRRALGDEHPMTVLTLGELPGVYWVEGKYPEAEPLYLKALELRRRLVGEEQDETVSTMNNLATLYMSEGKYPQAEPLLTKVVEIRSRKLGEDQPRTLISINNLATLYGNEGRYAEAEPLFTKVLAIRRRVLGEESPDTLKTMDSLAGLYRNEKKFSDAETLQKQVLDERRRVLGENHPDTLVSLNNMGKLYAEQSRYPEAEALFNQLLDARRRVLGPDHPDTIRVWIALGSVRLDQQRYSDAEAPLREALKKATPWEQFDAQSMLGAALAGQQKFSDAEPLLITGYEGLVSRESSIPAPNRGVVEQAGRRIVDLYERWVKPEKASEWREKIQRRPRDGSSRPTPDGWGVTYGRDHRANLAREQRCDLAHRARCHGV